MRVRRAADVMTRAVVTVGLNTRLTEVIDLLLRHGISGMPVVDEDSYLLGIISEHDVINFALSGVAADTCVSEAMTREVVSFPPDESCPAVVNCLVRKGLRRAPIVEDGKLIGIVSRRDLLRMLLNMYPSH